MGLFLVSGSPDSRGEVLVSNELNVIDKLAVATTLSIAIYTREFLAWGLSPAIFTFFPLSWHFPHVVIYTSH